MQNVTTADFRANLRSLLARSQIEPIRVLCRGTAESAIVVSPAWYARAALALEGVDYTAPQMTEAEEWALWLAAQKAAMTAEGDARG
ncbi:hypothetical protein [Brachybacterium hainanense]|uniref:Prevent-host-death protein n=1 Tax=Brachybacterium hainanense TaxID=1541174 RepID=A0ABV6REX1_9MICO